MVCAHLNILTQSSFMQLICYCMQRFLSILAVSATVAKVEAANASASGPGAEAETGVSWKYTGASAGAHLGEAQAGPFAVRAGFKFGIGFRYDVQCHHGM